ncbi:hypothetical protein HDE_12920 [Halotydeus destructor]|nr:hypothetical protein HDE_12920 [Halotydeus destructor]
MYTETDELFLLHFEDLTRYIFLKHRYAYLLNHLEIIQQDLKHEYVRGVRFLQQTRAYLPDEVFRSSVFSYDFVVPEELCSKLSCHDIPDLECGTRTVSVNCRNIGADPIFACQPGCRYFKTPTPDLSWFRGKCSLCLTEVKQLAMNPKLNVTGCSRNIPPLTWIESEQLAVHNTEYCANYNRAYDSVNRKCTGSVASFLRDITVGNELWCLIRDAVSSSRDFTSWHNEIFRPRRLCDKPQAYPLLDEQFGEIRVPAPLPKKDIFFEFFEWTASELFRAKRVYKRSTDANNFIGDTIEWIEEGPVQNSVLKTLAGLGVEEGVQVVVRSVTQAAVDRLKLVNTLLIRQSMANLTKTSARTAVRRLVTKFLVTSSFKSMDALRKTSIRIAKVGKLSNVTFFAPVLLDLLLSLIDYSEQKQFTSEEHLKAFTEEKLQFHELSSENAKFWDLQTEKRTFDAKALLDFLQEDLDPVDAEIYLRYTTVIRIFVLSWYLQQCISSLK